MNHVQYHGAKIYFGIQNQPSLNENNKKGGNNMWEFANNHPVMFTIGLIFFGVPLATFVMVALGSFFEIFKRNNKK